MFGVKAPISNSLKRIAFFMEEVSDAIDGDMISETTWDLLDQISNKFDKINVGGWWVKELLESDGFIRHLAKKDVKIQYNGKEEWVTVYLSCKYNGVVGYPVKREAVMGIDESTGRWVIVCYLNSTMWKDSFVRSKYQIYTELSHLLAHEFVHAYERLIRGRRKYNDVNESLYNGNKDDNREYEKSWKKYINQPQEMRATLGEAVWYAESELNRDYVASGGEKEFDKDYIDSLIRRSIKRSDNMSKRNRDEAYNYLEQFIIGKIDWMKKNYG